jgi:DegV family protein with EDD domain
MVNILTDSCSDLSADLLEKYKVSKIPLYVYINEKNYKDGAEISIQELFKIVGETKKLPKTSAPSIPDLENFFSSQHGDTIFIGIGSKLSATYQNACLAAQSFSNRKISIIDSQNLSAGIGLLVLHAAEMRDKGLSFEDIVIEVEALVPRIKTSFVIDTLDYLYMGGRCTAMENIIGSILKIRPVIEVKPDGTLGVKEKNRGTRRKSLDALIEDYQKNIALVNPHRVFITHTGCDDDALYLAEELRKISSIEELNITTAGATIASHCGPNTIGILYTLK